MSDNVWLNVGPEPDDEPERPAGSNRGVVVLALLLGVIVASLVASALLGRSDDAATDQVPPAPSPSVGAEADAELTPEPGDTTDPPSSEEDSGPGWPSDRPCQLPAADPALGERRFVDLDADGFPEVITPVGSTAAGLGQIVTVSVLKATTTCDWVTLASFGVGTSRDRQRLIYTNQVECVLGPDGLVHLAFISTRTEPVVVQTVQEWSMERGEFVAHRETVLNVDDPVFDRHDGDDTCASPTLEQPSVPVSRCGALHWEVDLPRGWQTAATGSAACHLFSPKSEYMPCQCDRVYPLQIRWSKEPLRTVEDFERISLVDEYRAYLTTTSFFDEAEQEMVRRRSWLVDLGIAGALIFSAIDAEAGDVAWEDLQTMLDEMVKSADLVGFPPPSMHSLYPDLVDVDATVGEATGLDGIGEVVAIDPAGKFALYAARWPGGDMACASEGHVQLFTLDIGLTQPDALDFSATGFTAPGGLRRVDLEGDTAVVRVGCVQADGSDLFEVRRLRLDAVGRVIEASRPVLDVDPWPTENDAAVPSVKFGDFEYRVATANDANRCGALEVGAGSGFVSAVPERRVDALAGSVRMGVGGLILWQVCNGRFAIGRVGTDGSIVDAHHLASADSTAVPSYAEAVVRDDGRMALLYRRSVSDSDWALGDEWGFPYLRVRQFLVPHLEWVAPESDPAFVVTANERIELSVETSVESIDGSGNWYLGQDLRQNERCSGQTLYENRGGGLRRVIDPSHDIEGSVFDVLVGPVESASRHDGLVRDVVVLVECIDEYQGLTVWAGREFVDGPAWPPPTIRLSPVSDRPVLSAQFADTGGPLALDVVYLDGSTGMLAIG